MNEKDQNNHPENADDNNSVNSEISNVTEENQTEVESTTPTQEIDETIVSVQEETPSRASASENGSTSQPNLNVDEPTVITDLNVPTKKKHKGLLVVGIIVAALLLLGGVAFAMRDELLYHFSPKVYVANVLKRTNDKIESETKDSMLFGGNHDLIEKTDKKDQQEEINEAMKLIMDTPWQASASISNLQLDGEEYRGTCDLMLGNNPTDNEFYSNVNIPITTPVTYDMNLNIFITDEGVFLDNNQSALYLSPEYLIASNTVDSIEDARKLNYGGIEEMLRDGLEASMNRTNSDVALVDDAKVEAYEQLFKDVINRSALTKETKVIAENGKDVKYKTVTIAISDDDMQQLFVSALDTLNFDALKQENLSTENIELMLDYSKKFIAAYDLSTEITVYMNGKYCQRFDINLPQLETPVEMVLKSNDQKNLINALSLEIKAADTSILIETSGIHNEKNQFINETKATVAGISLFESNIRLSTEKKITQFSFDMVAGNSMINSQMNILLSGNVDASIDDEVLIMTDHVLLTSNNEPILSCEANVHFTEKAQSPLQLSTNVVDATDATYQQFMMDVMQPKQAQ